MLLLEIYTEKAYNKKKKKINLLILINYCALYYYQNKHLLNANCIAL